MALAEGLLGNREEVYDPFAYEGIIQLANVDPDRAAQLLFSMKPQDTQYEGADVMVLTHIEARALFLQPDIQAYFVNEGKWIKLLAKLIPEYEKYVEE